MTSFIIGMILLKIELHSILFLNQYSLADLSLNQNGTVINQLIIAITANL